MPILTGKRVLIAEPIDGSEQTYQRFEELGCELVIGPHVAQKKNGYSEDALVELAKDVDAIIGMSREKITRRVLEGSKRLCTVAKYGIGVDHIDVAAATECNILVTNTPVHMITVAEYTVALMLGVSKKMCRNDRFLREGNWRNPTTIGVELFDKVIGLVGIGGIGGEVVKRLAGWGVEIIAYDPYIKPERAKELGVTMVDWDTLFQTADIVSLHMPLTPETRGIVSKREFWMMKPTSILINTARGPIVDQAALTEALQQGKIWGAGLDVMEKEPPVSTDPLLSMTERVILTPHTAAWTTEALLRMAQQAAKNTISALKGEHPQFVVNREAVPAWDKRFGGK